MMISPSDVITCGGVKFVFLSSLIDNLVILLELFPEARITMPYDGAVPENIKVVFGHYQNY